MDILNPLMESTSSQKDGELSMESVSFENSKLDTCPKCQGKYETARTHNDTVFHCVSCHTTEPMPV